MLEVRKRPDRSESRFGYDNSEVTVAQTHRQTREKLVTDAGNSPFSNLTISLSLSIYLCISVEVYFLCVILRPLFIVIL
jgi:hypothetical protein